MLYFAITLLRHDLLMLLDKLPSLFRRFRAMLLPTRYMR